MNFGANEVAESLPTSDQLPDTLNGFSGAEMAEKTAPKFDEFGNRTDINIPDYNRIAPEDDIATARAKREAQALSADIPVTSESSNSTSNDISMGGININFDITGAESPQEVMDTIKENIQDIADRIAQQLSASIANIHSNQPLEG